MGCLEIWPHRRASSGRLARGSQRGAVGRALGHSGAGPLGGLGRRPVMGYFTRSLGLGVMDRVIGVLFGIARGMVLVGLMIIGGELLHLNRGEWWTRSKPVPYGETVGDWLRAMVG